jgi:hypothetical protein
VDLRKKISKTQQLNAKSGSEIRRVNEPLDVEHTYPMSLFICAIVKIRKFGLGQFLPKNTRGQILSLSKAYNKVLRDVLAPSSHCSILIETP